MFRWFLDHSRHRSWELARRLQPSQFGLAQTEAEANRLVAHEATAEDGLRHLAVGCGKSSQVKARRGEARRGDDSTRVDMRQGEASQTKPGQVRSSLELLLFHLPVAVGIEGLEDPGDRFRRVARTFHTWYVAARARVSVSLGVGWGKSRHITPPRNATSRHAISRHAISRHATPRHATPRHAKSRRVKSSQRRVPPARQVCSSSSDRY